ncbi:DNRLRE domain-containing protein [candidate division KSB1 bacterium]|nr:DNRLRE domain-containing protein [candidate division KSB1 bacterium]
MKRLFGFLLIIVVISACTHDKPLPSGYEMLDRGDKGEIFVKTIPAVRSGTFWETPKAGIQGTLLLGETNNFKSFVLLRFISFTAIDSDLVTSATLNLTQFNSFGEGAECQASIYKVTDSWLADISDEAEWEKNVTWQDIQANVDQNTSYGTLTVSPQDSITTVSTPLDTSLVNEWVRSDTNYGIVLAFDQADLMVQFFSSEASNYFPTLDLIHIDTDSTIDTTSVSIYHDVSLIQYSTSVPEGELQENVDYINVGNGSGYKSLIQFDLTSIPEKATIHHALLSLTVNKNLNSTDTTGILIIATPVDEDSTWNPADLTLYSNITSPGAYAFDVYDSFSMDNADAAEKLSFFTQIWLWGDSGDGLDNNGLLLKANNAGVNITEISFYSGLSDSTKAPTMRITYSLPPTSRFSK